MTATLLKPAAAEAKAEGLAGHVAGSVPWSVVGLIGIGWLVAVVAQVTGNAVALHHHALIEGGPPLWLAIPIFLVAWQAMTASMMLPASLPAIRMFSVSAAPDRSTGRGSLLAFLAVYAVAWTVFGLAAFLGDVVLHHIVDVTPWLAARPAVIEASALFLAGAYQFTNLKYRSLAACRHPDEAVTESQPASGMRFALRHAVDCVTCSWALMLLMFAAGVANLWWMAALTLVMAYEANGRHGQRAAVAIGAVLLVLATFVLASGSVPGFSGV